MYSTKDIIRALKVLGFRVRAPDGGNTAYCLHEITKEELWVPTHVDTLDDDVLAFLFEHISLPMAYFQAVYTGLPIRSEYLHPTDQH